jgi:preprotein translocase subunit SecA
MFEDLSESLIDATIERGVAANAWDWDSVSNAITERYGLRVEFPEEMRSGLTAEKLQEQLVEMAEAAYRHREEELGEPVMRHLERVILLQTIDRQWKDHLRSMDHLKEGVSLRGYGQQNPLQVYQKEGFSLFGDMMDRIEAETVKKLLTVQLVREEDVEQLEERPRAQRMTLSHGAVTDAASAPSSREGPKVGRNDPCPCGSGKKYKRCHGQ